MGNSKTRAAARKHRHKQRAAKERVRAHLAGKLDADKMPQLARDYLVRTLRVTKKS